MVLRNFQSQSGFCEIKYLPANDILVLQESSSVEKLSGVGDPSLQAVILEDTPRPVPMHTLLKAKELQKCVVDMDSRKLYVMDAHPLGKDFGERCISQ
jgi:hypothetical protein